MPAALLVLALASSTTPQPEQETTHVTGQAEILGLRTDHGRAWDFGVAYLHANEWLVHRGGLGAMTVLQYGVDARAVRHDGEFRAVLGFGTARISMVGDAGGFGMESSLGLDLGHGAPVVGEVGAFFGAFFVELGYAYRFPIAHERPDWLSSHQFAVRVQIPVAHHSTHTWKEK
ncbi:MAG: hypothetical protein ACXWUG_08145 [Polyangiales bacterium]